MLDAVRAKQCTWLVCTQNQHNKDHEFSDATEPHGSAFLLGKISGIRRPPEDEASSDRWQIAISEYALINIPDIWDHGRNPVRYTSLADLGISLEKLEFRPMPKTAASNTNARIDKPTAEANKPILMDPQSTLTISEAKMRLAVTFGVKPESVEITIRA